MNSFLPLNSGVLFRRTSLAVFLAALYFTSPVLPRAARADEFSVVAPNDASYAQLASLAKAGWLDAATISVPKTSSTTRNTTLTRYEMALQVARAIFAVTACADADPDWSQTAPKASARALRDLANTFRTELKDLGVDVAATQKQLDSLSRVNLNSRPASAATAETVPALDLRNGVPDRVARQGRGLSLSQRLRVDAAASSLVRDADDLFGDAAFAAAGGDVARTNARLVPGSIQGRAGVALGVTDWLTLRAGYARRKASLVPSLTTSNARFAAPFGARELGGGVDIALPRGMTLSGDVANVVGVQPGAAAFTRLGGGLGWTGWQNRLSMKANLSRLVPGDARILPSTLVGLNVGLDVTQRLSLTLRYQQMFSAPETAESNRLVAGGVSLNF